MFDIPNLWKIPYLEIFFLIVEIMDLIFRVNECDLWYDLISHECLLTVQKPQQQRQMWSTLLLNVLLTFRADVNVGIEFKWIPPKKPPKLQIQIDKLTNINKVALVLLLLLVSLIIAYFASIIERVNIIYLF